LIYGCFFFFFSLSPFSFCHLLFLASCDMAPSGSESGLRGRVTAPKVRASFCDFITGLSVRELRRTRYWRPCLTVQHRGRLDASTQVLGD
jgi:hypothetical protein